MNLQRKKDNMRLPTFTFLLTFLLILTACATPATPSLETEPTIVSVEPTDSPTKATFESSLLAVELTGRSKGNLLYPLDPITGTALPGYTPISFGQNYSYAFSPDRSMLAAVVFPNDAAYHGNLLLVDLSTWKTQTFELNTNGWVGSMVFSPDGSWLALSQSESTYELTIFDLKAGVVAAHVEEDFLITRMKFTTDSESLMLYGMVIQNRYTENEMSAGAPNVKLLDATDLSPRWSVELEGVRDGVYPTDDAVAIDYNQPGTAMYLAPALAFAPNQNVLYVVHADSDRLTTVDFSTQKIATVEIQDQLSWFERLLSLTAGIAHAKVADGTSKQAVISPDGQFMYVVGMRNESLQDNKGNWQMNQTPLGLEIIQTNDGSRVEHFETEANDLSLSIDGRFLYLRNWMGNAPWSEIFDISTSQVITRKEWIYATPALRMNGEPLLVSTYSTSEFSHHMSILQPDGSELLTEWTGSNYFAWLTP
jgi:WD40 repeat protein